MKNKVSEIVIQAMNRLRSGDEQGAILLLREAVAKLNNDKPPVSSETPKPLTIFDLKHQLDLAINNLPRMFATDWSPSEHTDALFIIGDFEIRRRK